jgi:hypothetical protein
MLLIHGQLHVVDTVQHLRWNRIISIPNQWRYGFFNPKATDTSFVTVAQLEPFPVNKVGIERVKRGSLTCPS